MSECNCVIEPNEGRDDTACNAKSGDGNLCSKPEGHGGPHVACSIGTHPIEVWGRE